MCEVCSDQPHFFFFNATVATEIYTLSLHDALPILRRHLGSRGGPCVRIAVAMRHVGLFYRSEEHTSELQSRFDLVCRLLLEKKKSGCDTGNRLSKMLWIKSHATIFGVS